MFEEGRAPVFSDRRDAGRKLAEMLARYRDANAVVLGLPRGGIPVGYEVARALGAPLDIFAVRKIGAPQQPELGVGAVASGGLVVLDRATIQQLGITEEQVQAIIARESAEIERQLSQFASARRPVEVAGRTVILVDDGLATGITAAAAIQALRALSPSRIVLAVPVGAAQTVEWLRHRVDDLVVALVPANFAAVGLWYADFTQTSDAEVLELLAAAQAPDADPPAPGQAGA